MDYKRQSFSLKFVVVGDPMVGKTSMILSFTKNFFAESPSSETTTFPEKYCKELTVDDVKILFSVVDTPSLDGCYEKLRASVYPDAHCFIICYAVDNPSSFANVENQWLPEIHELCPNAVIILAGTKGDRPDSVTESVASKLAEKYRFDGYQKCSAQSPESVEKVFVDGINALAKVGGRRVPSQKLFDRLSVSLS